MPGIHVRTPDKFDWIYREKEPLLTVPGSYWLCHKKSIYKFTFKYHRESKDNKQFIYGKELMKVIRRIIKSQPRQGQQFGTRHLLVTYNHSSWTRQDKMFAMLKFREKTNATAFPRAFVLTVKLLSTNLIYQNETELDDDLVEYDTNEKNNSEESIKASQNVTTLEKKCNNSTKYQLTCSDDIRDDVKTPFSSPIESNESKKEISDKFFPDMKDLPFVRGCTSKQQDLLKTKHTINNKAETLNEIQESIDMPYQYLIEREIERTNSKGTDSSNVQSFPPVNALEEKPIRDSNESNVFRAKSVSTSNIIDNATARSANITDLVMEGLMFTITQNQDSITVLEQKTKSEPDEVLENSEKAETVEGSKHLINSSLFKLENLITKIEMSNNPQVVSEHEKDKQTPFLSSIFRRSDLMKQENVKKSYPKLNSSKDSDGTAINITINENEEKSEGKIFKSRPCRLMMNSLQTEEPAVPILKDSSNSTHNETKNQFDYKNSLDSETVIDKRMLLKHTKKNISIEQIKKRNKRVKNVNLNSNIYNNNGDDRVDDWNANDDEEEIIPEALQNHQSICCKIQKSNALSTKDSESNLLMDDMESDKESYSLNYNKLINKLHVPRVISNEAVQYDLSSLRTSQLPELTLNTSNPIVNTKINCKCVSKSCLYQDKCESCEETTNPIRKKLTARRRLYTQKLNTDDKEIAIEMWKFLQDITHGVKIVLQRLSL